MMKNSIQKITKVLVAASAAAALAHASPVTPLEIGKSAPDFSLKGTDGQIYKLSNYADKDVVVVVFGCNHCPFMVPAWTRLNAFATDYADKSVGFVVINSNDPNYGGGSDNFEAMIKEYSKQSMKFPYLYDGETQQAAAAYGALATPHAFVFNKERKLVYQGQFDNGKRNAGPTAINTVRDNVDAVLAGKNIATTTTKAIGCSIKWKK